MSYVNMTMRSTQDWRTVAHAQAFAGILTIPDEFLLPQKIDSQEPQRFNFDPHHLDKFYEIWGSDLGWLYLKRRKPYLWWMTLKLWLQEMKRFSEIVSGFDERYFKKGEGVDKLLSVAKQFYEWGAIDHGYICHEENWNDKNYLGTPFLTSSGRMTSTGGLWLEEGLPGIYWANFFGPLYVDFFGREKLSTTPAYHKEELPNGGFLLLTAASPLEYERSEVRALVEEIISHLGQDAFFEKQHLQKRCASPDFSFVQIQVEPFAEMLAGDPVIQVFPDPYEFIKKTPNLAESLRKRYADNLDYSPESLRRVDELIMKRSYRRPEPWSTVKGCQLLRELTAYYGEVLRHHLGGEWLVQEKGEGFSHPAITFSIKGKNQVEYPFTRIMRLWLERISADGLATRYYLLQTEQIPPFPR